MTDNSEPGFWEKAFAEKQEMWGFEPAVSAVLAKDFFLEKGLKNILIPGIGYGRNANIFRESGMEVTGIEISETAIKLARKHIGSSLKIYHGPVTGMPFDSATYDGIFCYALIHLLDADNRQKLIKDCFNQLQEGGYMVFTAISKQAHTYGQGKFISTNRYEIFEGVKMFFYDQATVNAEFGKCGLVEIKEVADVFPFYFITCQKRKHR